MWQRRSRWPVGGPRESQPRGQPVTVPTRQPCRGSPAARFPLVIYLSLTVHSSSCQCPSSSIFPFSPLLCWVWHRFSDPFASTGYQGQGMLSRPLCIAPIQVIWHPVSGASLTMGAEPQACKCTATVSKLLWPAGRGRSVVHQRGNYFPRWAWNWTSCPFKPPRTDWDAAPPFIRSAAYEEGASKTDKVKALLWPVINWFASQTGWEGGGGGEWHSEDMKRMRKSQIQCRRGGILQIKISQVEGTEEMRRRSCFWSHAVWPLFQVYQLGSTHQGQSPQCEQVVGININGNHRKIIAVILVWLLRHDYPKASYRFLYLPLTTRDHSQYQVT